MKLTALHIYPHYSADGYRVTAEFEGRKGKVELACSPALGNRIVDVCMDEIVEAVKEAATLTVESLLSEPEAEEVKAPA